MIPPPPRSTLFPYTTLFRSLDRGVTLANLIGFYYGRRPQKFQQDTVLQHSRMYGYRRDDLAVTRFYTSAYRSEEHTPELQSQSNLVCRLLLEKQKTRLCTPS